MSRLQTLKTVVSQPRYWPFILQRRFLNSAMRARMSRLIADRRPAAAQSPAPSAERGQLDKDGILHLGQLLQPAEVAAARDYLAQRSVADPYRTELPAFLPLEDGRAPETHVAFHEPEDVIAAPHLIALANRPEILAHVEAFLGCKPTIGFLTAWWSYPTPIGPQQAENFHRDVDDWRFIKLFVYLTDVGDTQGPHIYVRGSAGDPRLLKIARFTDEEVEKTFGAEAIMVNRGAAGSGFLENTFGVHKGQPVREGQRLIFQAVYCVGSVPYRPEKPVAKRSDVEAATGITLDPFVNRHYLSD